MHRGPTRCLCQLRLRNKIPQRGSKQQTSLSQALEAGSLRSVSAPLGSRLIDGAFSLRPHVEEGRGSSGGLFYKETNCIMGAPPHDLITPKDPPPHTINHTGG